MLAREKSFPSPSGGGAPKRGAGAPVSGDATVKAHVSTRTIAALHPAAGSHPRLRRGNPAPPSAGAGWGWFLFGQRAPYLLLDSFNILQNFIVPEPQDAVTLGFKTLRAPGVISRALCMLPAVNFDGKASFHADEVHNKCCDGMLSAKSVAGELAHSKMTPQQLLCISEIASQPAGCGARTCRQSWHVLCTTPIPTVPAQSAASDWALGGSEQCSSKPRLAPLRGKE